MSIITNSSFIGGETLSTTDINNKFQDVTDATTTSLDESNFRDQSIDLAQMDSNASHGRSGIQLVTMAHGSVGTSDDLTTSRSYSTSRTGQNLLDAGGTATNLVVNAVLSTDDILRVYYSGRITTTTAITANASDPYSNACWAFWLQWDITDATLTNWTEVPNQGDWNNQITASRYAEPTDVVLSTTNGIASTAIVPHFLHIDDGGSATIQSAAYNNVNGSYFYKNAGGNVTIYGLRIIVGGVYRGVWEQNATGTTRRNYLEYTNDGAYVDTDSDTIAVYNMQIASLIMRTT